MVKKIVGVTVVVTSLVFGMEVGSQDRPQGGILQPLSTTPFELPDGAIYCFQICRGWHSENLKDNFIFDFKRVKPLERVKSILLSCLT